MPAVHFGHAPPEPGGMSDRLELMEFQHMLASEGMHVDLLRLQRDPSYARKALVRAIQSSDAALRQCARRLSASFILDA